jgi:hypothetical protein
VDFPLRLSFKLIALAPQIYVEDASGRSLLFVQQKLFKLKEAIHVFSDSSKSRELYAIQADRIIDFSAQYTFRDTTGATIGSIKRHGFQSLWSAAFQVFGEGGQPLFTIKEENAWIKVLDGVIEGIPIVGLFSGYFFHPAYIARREGTGEPVMRLVKRPALFEGRFDIELLSQQLTEREQEQSVLALLMVTLLQRERG